MRQDPELHEAAFNAGKAGVDAVKAKRAAMAAALETMVIQMHSERVARQWRAQANPWIGAARGVVA